jgi:hypothetical protein
MLAVRVGELAQLAPPELVDAYYPGAPIGRAR